MAIGQDRDRRRQAIRYGVIAASGVIVLTVVGILSDVFTEGWQFWPGVALISLVAAASALAYFGESRSHLGMISHPSGPLPLERRLNTLPRDTSGFTGRDQEIAEIVRLVGNPAGSGIKVCALEGMGGIGKTALAVHAAHLLADQYPEMQLYLDLRAHAMEQAPLGTEVALELLLSSLGVPADQIPDGVDARSARWRALAARRRCLIVLDDAAGPDQVRPLLPGTGESLVIITSRMRMTDLETRTRFRWM
ncbi:hypothetical protein [Actinomadura sp. 9N215]|uniref:hypothetical protein n=1 Tax=Actinomadura sp. 9N215 TaxID=3375150 RepID=UPI00378ACAC2